jgi:hypothetical protein
MKQESTEDISCHHYTYTSRLHFTSRALTCSIPFSILLFLEAGVTRSSDNAFSFHPGLNLKVLNPNPTQHPKPRQHPKSPCSRLGRGHEAHVEATRCARCGSKRVTQSTTQARTPYPPAGVGVKSAMTHEPKDTLPGVRGRSGGRVGGVVWGGRRADSVREREFICNHDFPERGLGRRPRTYLEYCVIKQGERKLVHLSCWFS